MNRRKSIRTLRIIGGVFRHRLVGFPDLPGLRPTPDRVRETLFNWLSPWIAGARCLDLFAGSGILGMEALSRGAGHVTIIDQSAEVIEHIGQQLLTLGAPRDRYRLHCADAPAWLKSGTDPERQAFDLVFLDPPFHDNLLEPACELLASRGLLAPGGLIYIESSTPELPSYWSIYRQKRAGQVFHSLCKST